MGSERIRIGDMLVAAGFVTDEQVQKALARQKETGRRLGEELVDLGFVSEVQLTQILSNQLSIPWVSLYHVQFSRDLLNLIPAETAEECCLIPIYIRKVRREGDTLFVAMDDPTNEQSLARVREVAGLPVKPMVAPPTEIRDAIRVYYFGGRRAAPPVTAPTSDESAAQRSGPPPPPPEAATKGQSKPPAPPKPGRTSGPPPSSPRGQAEHDTTKDSSGASVATPAAPSPAAGAESPADAAPSGGGSPSHAASRSGGGESARRAQRMITLTLLDGTEVRLPARRKGEGAADGEPAPTEQGMTASDLVQALFARAQGADVSDVLPADARWETLFGTLLTLLLRKGLIADWEFVEEWRRRQE